MRAFVLALVVVLVVSLVQSSESGKTKRKKIVLVVPEKVKHIHHHHVKKVYITSKPPHHFSSYEEGLHREDLEGSFESGGNVGAKKFRSHHKRHSSDRHPREHKEESKKVVVHSEELPDASEYYEEKSPEIHRPPAIFSKPGKQGQEHETVIYLDDIDSSIISDPSSEKTRHHNHHHSHRNHKNHSHKDKFKKHEPKPSKQKNKPERGKKSHRNKFERNRFNITLNENLVPPPINQQSFTGTRNGFVHNQQGGPPMGPQGTKIPREIMSQTNQGPNGRGPFGSKNQKGPNFQNGSNRPPQPGHPGLKPLPVPNQPPHQWRNR